MPSVASISEDVKTAVKANKEEILAGIIGAVTVIAIPAAFKILIDKIGGSNE